ncbi:hypothetical protein BGP_4809 [Beggiatoa sp. PS]|nr:hypothetical protein BGP_4809 [Beggiatoa sp. PS]
MLIEITNSVFTAVLVFTTIALTYATFRLARTTRESVMDAKRKGFEDKLFQLLRFQNEMVNNLKYNTGEETRTGRDCLVEFRKELFEEYKGIYEDFYSKGQQHEIGHYFRHLYHILKFISESQDVDMSENYANLVRAQLSGEELVLLFYNCRCKKPNFETFYKLVENFELLKDMRGRWLSFDSDGLPLETEEKRKEFYQKCYPQNAKANGYRD